MEWEWYRDSHMVHLLTHLIIKANHKDGMWMGVSVSRGEVVTGLHSLSSETGISIRSIRTCLSRMENLEISTIKTTNKYRVIRVNNYDTYQSLESDNDKQPDKRPTSKRQTNDNKQECKESKNEKNNSKSIIDTIYNMFPRKVAPGAAKVAIEKALKRVDAETLIQAVGNYAELVRGKDKKFIPHPATWFNQDRWLDEDIVRKRTNLMLLPREEGVELIKKYEKVAGLDWDWSYPQSMAKLQEYYDNGGFEYET